MEHIILVVCFMHFPYTAVVLVVRSSEQPRRQLMVTWLDLSAFSRWGFSSCLIWFLRNRMTLMPSQAFYLLINNSGIASMSLTMAQLYKDHKDEDGFLYMTYASQEMFGHCSNNNRWRVQMSSGGFGGSHLLHWTVIKYLSLCI